ASQGNSVAYRVRTVVFDRANVRRLHLRAAPSVDESQASDSACVLVRVADMSAKGDVAEFSVDDLRNSGASDIFGNVFGQSELARRIHDKRLGVGRTLPRLWGQ